MEKVVFGLNGRAEVRIDRKLHRERGPPALLTAGIDSAVMMVDYKKAGHQMDVRSYKSILCEAKIELATHSMGLAIHENGNGKTCGGFGHPFA